jgi:hypothetical protein
MEKLSCFVTHPPQMVPCLAKQEHMCYICGRKVSPKGNGTGIGCRQEQQGWISEPEAGKSHRRGKEEASAQKANSSNRDLCPFQV